MAGPLAGVPGSAGDPDPCWRSGARPLAGEEVFEADRVVAGGQFQQR
jgi:hypothetical protein